MIWESTDYLLNDQIETFEQRVLKSADRRQLKNANSDELRSFFLGMLSHILFSPVAQRNFIAKSWLSSFPNEILFILQYASTETRTHTMFHISFSETDDNSKNVGKFSIDIQKLQDLGMKMRLSDLVDVYRISIDRNLQNEKYPLTFRTCRNFVYFRDIETSSSSANFLSLAPDTKYYDKSFDDLLSYNEKPSFFDDVLKEFNNFSAILEILPSTNHLYRFIDGCLVNFEEDNRLETILRLDFSPVPKIRDLSYSRNIWRSDKFLGGFYGVPVTLKIFDVHQTQSRITSSVLPPPREIETESNQYIVTLAEFDSRKSIIIDSDTNIYSTIDKSIIFPSDINSQTKIDNPIELRTEFLFDQLERFSNIYGFDRKLLQSYFVGKFSGSAGTENFLVRFKSGHSLQVLGFLIKSEIEATFIILTATNSDRFQFKTIELAFKKADIVFRSFTLMNIIDFSKNAIKIDTVQRNFPSCYEQADIEELDIQMDLIKQIDVMKIFETETIRGKEYYEIVFGNLMIDFAKKFSIDIQNPKISSALTYGLLSSAVLVLHPVRSDPTILGLLRFFPKGPKNEEKSRIDWKHLWLKFSSHASSKNRLESVAEKFSNTVKWLCNQRRIRWQEGNSKVVFVRKITIENGFEITLC